jgi:pimeloyl-ACP methyl ester carboxylesterase
VIIKFTSDVVPKSDGWYVDSSVAAADFESCVPLKNCKIWTRRFRPSGSRDAETPLVMIHGMGAGLGFFCLNFEGLVRDRTVYAIDLPGM